MPDAASLPNFYKKKFIQNRFESSYLIKIKLRFADAYSNETESNAETDKRGDY